MRTPAIAAALALAAGGPGWAAFQLILPHVDPPAAQQAAEPESPGSVSRPPDPLGPAPPVAESECTAPVRPGDSLAILARRHLGDAGRWREIQALNHIRDPHLIGAGWTLAIPCDGFTGTPSPGKPTRDPRDPPEPVPETVAGNPADEAPSTDADQVEETVAEIIEEIEADAAGREAGAEEYPPPDRDAGTAAAEDTGSPVPTVPPSDEGQPVARAAAEEDDPPARADNCSVTVAGGDSLAVLARRHLGDAGRWPEIQELNDILNPDLISAGQQLRLPCASATATTAPAAQTRADTIPDDRDPGPPAVPARSWTGRAGERLDDVITRWAISAGWTPIITERWTWELDTDVSVSGTFIEGVRKLLAGFSSSGTAPGVAVYANQVLVLEYR